MKKSKDLFSQLILKVGRTPYKARQHCCQVDETKTWRTNQVWSTSFVENTPRPKLCILSALCGVNLGNIYLSNQFNLGNLWLKINQSKITNYAKRTQFSKKSNIYNRNFNNGLQRKMHNGHLVKTNPNKANFKMA